MFFTFCYLISEEAMGSDFSRFGEPTTSAEDKQRVVDTTDGKNDDTITFNDASYYNGPQPSKTQGPKTIHQKLLDILYSKQFQIIVIVLVIVDCILVVGELILDFSTLEVCINLHFLYYLGDERGYMYTIWWQQWDVFQVPGLSENYLVVGPDPTTATKL